MKIERHYCIRTSLLHYYRLDQSNYEQTLDKLATSALRVKVSAQPE